MIDLKHKLTGILFLVCLIIPLVIVFFYLHYQISMVQKEVKELMIPGMEKDELVVLKFTREKAQKELDWKHSKEFEYKGEMYDVVEKEIKGDTIYYHCWWDHRETELNEQLDILVAKILGNNPQKQNSRDRIVEFYKNLYFSKYKYNSSVLKKDLNPFYRFYTENFKSIDLPPPVPPPIVE